MFYPSPNCVQGRVTWAGDGLGINAKVLAVRLEKKEIAHLSTDRLHDLPALLRCDYAPMIIAHDGALAKGLGGDNSYGQKERMLMCLSTV